MTIPEAASLVLQAATFGSDGNIFVLDMGTPVKTDDLARNMIRLSGMKPDQDIQIIYNPLWKLRNRIDNGQSSKEGVR